MVYLKFKVSAGQLLKEENDFSRNLIVIFREKIKKKLFRNALLNGYDENFRLAVFFYNTTRRQAQMIFLGDFGEC